MAARSSVLRLQAMREANRDPYRGGVSRVDADDDRRVDGWANLFAGFGVRGRDPSMGDKVTPPVEFTRDELQWCFRGDGIGARCMSLLPNEALRTGWALKVKRLRGDRDEVSPEDASEIVQDSTDYLRRRKAKKTALRGLVDAQVFGGAIIIAGADDGQPFDRPLREEAIKTVRWFRELDRHAVESGPLELDPTSDNYGSPQWYSVAGPNYDTREQIHASRCIRIDGIYTPAPSNAAGDPNRGWSDSVLVSLWDHLRHFNFAIASVARSIRDHARAYYKIKGLHQQVAGNRIEQVRLRMEVAELSLSALNAMMLDADGEDFGFMARPVAGVAELFDRLGIALAAARGAPITLLLGLSPGGFGTGEDEDRRWTNVVEAYRADDAVPVLEQMHRFVFAAKDGPTGGAVPDRFSIEMNPLRAPSQKEIAETRKSWVDAVVAAVREQILLPEEAAESMFGRGEFSMDIALDREAREALEETQSEEIDPSDPIAQALEQMRKQPPGKTPNEEPPADEG